MINEVWNNYQELYAINYPSLSFKILNAKISNGKWNRQDGKCIKNI